MTWMSMRGNNWHHEVIEKRTQARPKKSSPPSASSGAPGRFGISVFLLIPLKKKMYMLCKQKGQ